MDDIRFADMLEYDTRWLNLSTSLWCSIMAEADRDFLDIDRTTQEINDIMDIFDNWILQRITLLEFTYLFKDWCGHGGKGTILSIENSGIRGRVSRNTDTPDITLFRSILIKRQYSVSDLEERISILLQIFEQDLLLALPDSLGLSGRWLEVSMELFSSLDNLGYGFWHFDELSFFSSCLSIGIQSWNNQSEMEADLSLTTTTAISLALMNNCGGHLLIGNPDEMYSETDRLNPNKPPVITMSMFQRIMAIKKVTVAGLEALLVHITSCLKILADMVLEEMPSLRSACWLTTVTNDKSNNNDINEVECGPKLWVVASERALLSISNGSVPPELVALGPFLRSDARLLLLTYWLASQRSQDLETMATPSEVMIQEPQSPKHIPQHGSSLQRTAERIYVAFNQWGQERMKITHSATTMGTKSIPFASTHRNTMGVYTNDIAFQYIIACLQEYKRLQLLLRDALLIIANGIVGIEGNQGTSFLGGICAQVLPDFALAASEMGIQDEIYSENDAIWDHHGPLDAEDISVTESGEWSVVHDGVPLDTGIRMSQYSFPSAAQAPTFSPPRPSAFDDQGHVLSGRESQVTSPALSNMSGVTSNTKRAVSFADTSRANGTSKSNNHGGNNSEINDENDNDGLLRAAWEEYFVSNDPRQRVVDPNDSNHDDNSQEIPQQDLNEQHQRQKSQGRKQSINLPAPPGALTKAPSARSAEWYKLSERRLSTLSRRDNESNINNDRDKSSLPTPHRARSFSELSGNISVEGDGSAGGADVDTGSIMAESAYTPPPPRHGRHRWTRPTHADNLTSQNFDQNNRHDINGITNPVESRTRPGLAKWESSDMADAYQAFRNNNGQILPAGVTTSSSNINSANKVENRSGSVGNNNSKRDSNLMQMQRASTLSSYLQGEKESLQRSSINIKIDDEVKPEVEELIGLLDSNTPIDTVVEKLWYLREKRNGSPSNDNQGRDSNNLHNKQKQGSFSTRDSERAVLAIEGEGDDDHTVSSIKTDDSANSIAELLAKGKTSGVYASSLRELLRTSTTKGNSKANKKINSQSNEGIDMNAVLELGMQISQNEERLKEEEPRTAAAPRNVVSERLMQKTIPSNRNNLKELYVDVVDHSDETLHKQINKSKLNSHPQSTSQKWISPASKLGRSGRAQYHPATALRPGSVKDNNTYLSISNTSLYKGSSPPTAVSTDEHNYARQTREMYNQGKNDDTDFGGSKRKNMNGNHVTSSRGIIRGVVPKGSPPYDMNTIMPMQLSERPAWQSPNFRGVWKENKNNSSKSPGSSNSHNSSMRMRGIRESGGVVPELATDTPFVLVNNRINNSTNDRRSGSGGDDSSTNRKLIFPINRTSGKGIPGIEPKTPLGRRKPAFT